MSLDFSMSSVRGGMEQPYLNRSSRNYDGLDWNTLLKVFPPLLVISLGPWKRDLGDVLTHKDLYWEKYISKLGNNVWKYYYTVILLLVSNLKKEVTVCNWHPLVQRMKHPWLQRVGDRLARRGVEGRSLRGSGGKSETETEAAWTQVTASGTERRRNAVSPAPRIAPHCDSSARGLNGLPFRNRGRDPGSTASHAPLPP